MSQEWVIDESSLPPTLDAAAAASNDRDGLGLPGQFVPHRHGDES